MHEPTLEGIWSHASESFPECTEFMCIDVVRGRIVAFVPVSSTEQRQHSLKLFFRPKSPGAIESRVWSTHEWPEKEHKYRFDGDDLIWTYGGKDHCWKRTPSIALPDWLEADLAKAHRKMDEAEHF